jgi:hypothetical protein
MKTPWQQRNDGRTLETDLPYTSVNKNFNIERYGETDEPQSVDMDGYGQSRVSRPLVFNLKGKYD